MASVLNSVMTWVSDALGTLLPEHELDRACKLAEYFPGIDTERVASILQEERFEELHACFPEECWAKVFDILASLYSATMHHGLRRAFFSAMSEEQRVRAEGQSRICHKLDKEDEWVKLDFEDCVEQPVSKEDFYKEALAKAVATGDLDLIRRISSEVPKQSLMEFAGVKPPAKQTVKRGEEKTGLSGMLKG